MFFCCDQAIIDEQRVDQDSEIANTILSSTRIVDSSYFLVKERPMTCRLEEYKQEYEVSHYGITFIKIPNLDDYKIHQDEFEKSFKYEDKSIYGSWSNNVKVLKRISYSEIPTFEGDSIAALNWEEINENLGFGFIVLSKPININNKYAFIGLNLYSKSDFVSILYFLEYSEGNWKIIDYHGAYFEFGKAVIDTTTGGFPIHPYSIAIVGEIDNILSENYQPITTPICNAGRFRLLRKGISQPNAKSFDLVSTRIIFKTK